MVRDSLLWQDNAEAAVKSDEASRRSMRSLDGSTERKASEDWVELLADRTSKNEAELSPSEEPWLPLIELSDCADLVESAAVNGGNVCVKQRSLEASVLVSKPGSRCVTKTYLLCRAVVPRGFRRICNGVVLGVCVVSPSDRGRLLSNHQVRCACVRSAKQQEWATRSQGWVETRTETTTETQEMIRA